MFIRFSVAILLLTVSTVHADVFSFEATAFLDRSGWVLLQNYCDPNMRIEDGWFHQHVEMCPGDPPPGGQSSVYRRSLEEYIGVETFFLEWVVETDADASELPWGGGANISAWSNGGVNSAFYIAGDLVELYRDYTIPSVFIELEPGQAGAFDFAILLGSWGLCPEPPANSPADLDVDGFVNAFDLATLLGSWG